MTTKSLLIGVVVNYIYDTHGYFSLQKILNDKVSC